MASYGKLNWGGMDGEHSAMKDYAKSNPGVFSGFNRNVHVWKILQRKYSSVGIEMNVKEN